ncbi:hypothetical protein B0J17DRAFT_720829 [Rhizoctonia solani]|nr:hypothetical protein B0J17DRAFT_720829 [Rhizoctonia solani]
MHLEKQRLAKKTHSTSKAASDSKKVTLRITKPVLRVKSQESTQSQATALFEEEVDELEGNVDLFVPLGADSSIEVEDASDDGVLRESDEDMEMKERRGEGIGGDEEEEVEEEEEEEEVEEAEEVEEEDLPKPKKKEPEEDQSEKDAEVKTLDLWGTNNFQFFQLKAVNVVRVDCADLHLSYWFSNSQPSDPYPVLEHCDDWECLVREFGQHWKQVWKGNSTLSVWIKVKVDGMDEAKKPAKKGKRWKSKSKVLSDDSDESGSSKDDAIFNKCNNHPEKICYITNDGVHHIITHADSAAWATLIKAGKATVDAPPDKLHLTDQPVKHCGIAGPCSPVPTGSSEVAVGTSMFGDPTSFGIALASFMHHTQEVGGVSLPSKAAPEVVTDTMDDLAADPEFPSIQDWLTSVQDTYPGLMAYANVLEECQLTHLNQLDSHDMTVSALVSIGMGFLDASAFLHMG